MVAGIVRPINPRRTSRFAAVSGTTAERTVPGNGRPFTSDTLLAMTRNLLSASLDRNADSETSNSMISEHGPIETYMIQDVHHLPPGERRAIHDGRRDGGGRQIISAERHQDRRLGALEPAQHRRRTAETAYAAAFDGVDFIDIVDMENGDRRTGLCIGAIARDRGSR